MNSAAVVADGFGRFRRLKRLDVWTRKPALLWPHHEGSSSSTFKVMMLTLLGVVRNDGVSGAAGASLRRGPR